MTAVVVASAKGAPGVSTAALLLAAAFTGQERHSVLVEADPSGNVAGARFSIGTNPGLLSLAAESRIGGLNRSTLSDHGRLVTEQLLLIPGPATADESFAVISECASLLGQMAEADDGTWVIDVGRLTSRSPSLLFAQRAAVVLLVCRSTFEELYAVRALVAVLTRMGTDVRLGLVGRCPYSTDEVVEFVGAKVLWNLPDTREATSVVLSAVGAKRGRTSSLWRGSLAVAACLSDEFAERTLAATPSAAPFAGEG